MENLDPIVIISILAGAILLLLFIGAPIKPISWIGQGMIRILVGALFLFFINAFGTMIGFHIPINIATASVSGILGIPGIIALIAIKQFLII